MNYIEKHCENLPITLNDGTHIRCEEDVFDFFSSLGCDKFDFEALRNIMCGYLIEENEALEDDRKYYERRADELYQDLYHFAFDVKDLAEELASGKGGTKAKYAEKFCKLADYYMP